MIRKLFESVMTFIYTLDSALFRGTAQSLVFGMDIKSADSDTVAEITVSHCDEENGTYEAVCDERLFLDRTKVKRDSDTGEIIKAYLSVPVSAGDLFNMDIDLLGCSKYIKISVEYRANGSPANVDVDYCCALGDFKVEPASL